MRPRLAAVGLCLTLLASGCGGAPSLEDYSPKNSDEAQIVAILLRIPNGIKARSLDMILLPYAEDVYVANFQKYLGVAGPGAPVSISKPELRDVYAQVLHASKDISMDVKDFRLHLSGDRAVAQARTELLFKREGGRREAKEDLYLNEVIWRMRRGPAGWRIVEEIWH